MQIKKKISVNFVISPKPQGIVSNRIHLINIPVLGKFFACYCGLQDLTYKTDDTLKINF